MVRFIQNQNVSDQPRLKERAASQAILPPQMSLEYPSHSPLSPTVSHLESLPPAITSYLFSQLPPSTLAVLSLTSQTLRRKISKPIDPFFVLNKKGMEYERAKFLVTALDRFYPEHLICYACGVFHARWKVEITKWRKKCRKVPAVPCKHAESQLMSEFMSHRRPFSWLAVYETMRSHRHSPDLGSKKLHFTCEAPTEFRWWHDSLTIFVHGRLLLRDRWYQPVNLQENLTQQLGYDDTRLFCPHSGELFNGLHMREAFHGAVNHVRKPENIHCGFTYKRHRCPICPTEITIDIQPHSGFDGRFNWTKTLPCPPASEHVLSFSRYVDFGACIAPDEKEWISLTTWIKKPLSANYIQPGWPGHIPAPGLATRPVLDLRWMEPTSLRFRRYAGLRKLKECVEVNEGLGTPPPYQECTCQVHCPRFGGDKMGQ